MGEIQRRKPKWHEDNHCVFCKSENTSVQNTSKGSKNTVEFGGKALTYMCVFLSASAFPFEICDNCTSLLFIFRRLSVWLQTLMHLPVFLSIIFSVLDNHIKKHEKQWTRLFVIGRKKIILQCKQTAWSNFLILDMGGLRVRLVLVLSGLVYTVAKACLWIFYQATTSGDEKWSWKCQILYTVSKAEGIFEYEGFSRRTLYQ